MQIPHTVSTPPQGNIFQHTNPCLTQFISSHQIPEMPNYIRIPDFLNASEKLLKNWSHCQSKTQTQNLTGNSNRQLQIVFSLLKSFEKMHILIYKEKYISTSNYFIEKNQLFFMISIVTVTIRKSSQTVKVLIHIF